VIGDEFVVDGDAMRLTQIFSNLLQNASKFTERGGRIEVEARSVGGEAEVSVRDNGDGIAPELLERLYDLFLQGDRSLERRHGGLGIGLTIVRRLGRAAPRIRGRKSDGPGAGSEFTVRLPIVAGGGGESAARRLRRVDRERAAHPARGRQPRQPGRALRSCSSSRETRCAPRATVPQPSPRRSRSGPTSRCSTSGCRA
jgi:hypothetical protein